jgi:hypothetical protein
MKNLFFLLLFCNGWAISFSQLPGCTDSLATNYSAAATYNNGSCIYTATSYTPIIKVDPLSDSVVETSGLQMAGGYLWTFNDKDGKPALYRIDTVSNAITQRIILNNTTNNDWEDIGFDGTNFYIGDFGNNKTGGRTDLAIYKFPFSAIAINNPVDTIQTDEMEVIHFIYSDQQQPVIATGYNNTKYDCEAMIVDNDKIHLFSKNWVDNTTTHYVLNSTHAGNYTAIAMEVFATGYLVTAADKVAGQNCITLLGYANSGSGNHYLHIFSDYSADSFFTGNKRRIDLGDASIMGQSEGLCFRTGKYGYISNEKFIRMVGPFTISVNQKLRSFNLDGLVGDYFTQYTFTGNGNWSTKSNWKNNMIPPANLFPGNEITIDPAIGGSCILNIPYRIPAGAKLTIKRNKQFLLNGNLTIY